MNSHDARSSGESFSLVGMGASVGALVALEPFLSQVPTGSGLAFVITSPDVTARKQLQAELAATQARLAVLMKNAAPLGEANGVS